MGSGKQPKLSDRPIINRPKPKQTSKGSGGDGSGSYSKAENLNLFCLPSFDMKLSDNPLLKVGHQLQIQVTDSDEMFILLGNKKIGVVKKTYIDRLNKCKEFGFVYKVTVAQDKKETMYARFTRYTK